MKSLKPTKPDRQQSAKQVKKQLKIMVGDNKSKEEELKEFNYTGSFGLPPKQVA
jgi:hypothetical protein